jgi:hypothetical protein
MAAKYEAFVEWPARRVKMTKKADNKRKASFDIEDTPMRELRTKIREDFTAGPSNKGKRIVPSEAQNRTKRLTELQVQQDFR